MYGLTFPVCVAGATASIAQLISSACLIRIAGDILLEDYVTSLAIAASVLDMTMVMLLVNSIGLTFRRFSDWLVVGFSVLALAVWFSGNVISLITFGLTLVTYQSGGQSNREYYNLAVAGLTIGVIGLAPQAAFIVLISPRMERRRCAAVHGVESQQLPSQDGKQRAGLHTVPLASISTMTNSESHEMSPRSVMEWPSSPTSLLKNSIRRAVRPITSRTNLISTRSSTPRESFSIYTERNASVDPVRHDGFDGWDTSSVEERFEFPSCPNAQPNRPTLETIPGSRPLSMISTLDYLHAEQPVTLSKGRETPLPDSPTYSVVSPISETSCVSPVMPLPPDQSNIHPLFRTESPGPGPVTTPGTVIVASPHAGQIVGPEHTLSSRRLWISASRAHSPVVRSPEDSSRNFPSFRFPANLEDEGLRRSESQLSKVSFVNEDL